MRIPKKTKEEVFFQKLPVQEKLKIQDIQAELISKNFAQDHPFPWKSCWREALRLYKLESLKISRIKDG